MNQLRAEIPRSQARLILSSERGRDPANPLDKSTISKWCAELGFETGLRFFTQSQFAQLRAINHHYASGGNRSELIQKLRRIQQW